MIASLLVPLDDRYAPAAVRAVIDESVAAGYDLKNLERVDERYLSWVDAAFGGTWSSELAVGSGWFASLADEPVGLAGYGATGLRYKWLRSWQRERDVGIAGPIDIVTEHRKRPLARALAFAALGSLRERGFKRALIPAVDLQSTSGVLQRDLGATVVDRFRIEQAAKPLRTTVLASGGGTNFQAVLDAVAAGLGLNVVALVSNRPDAFALERARAAKVPALVAKWDRAQVARDDYDSALMEVVEGTEPELILLLGWMHLLPERFVERFPEAINIHPAFLPYDTTADTVTMPDGATIPAFRGAHSIADAVAAGSPWYGATAHRLSFETDRGTILMRAPLPLTERDEPAALAALRPVEHAVLLGAIRRALSEV